MENLPKICVDTTDAFMTTERFGTREEVIRWIKKVGIDNKVTVITSRSDTETGKRGRSNKIIFGCDKGGKHKISDSGTQSASKKCGCPFKIRSTPAKDGSGWKIDVKYGLHNHGLPDRLEGHSFIGRLTTDEKQHVADLAKRHVNMKEGFPLPPVTLDWKKFCSHIATTWMLGFAGRMQHWKLLTPVLA
ncbi:hypothetical protein KIW84_060217 [Lathyrus oleraceus]|uniref:FAR1 domain-containing protein n=1 Tax=Pisum sativum TaxID=3888 RepID=A0A9D5A3J3_PEA|nr:hypothetical protein KIW84_060217 [Pisum sativum]